MNRWLPERGVVASEEDENLAALLALHQGGSKLGGALDRPDLYVAGKQVDVPMVGVAPAVARRPILSLKGLDSQASGLHVIATCELLNPVPADFVEDAALLLQFGVGGAQHRVEVDLGGRGVHAIVPGAGVDVEVAASGSGTLRVRATAAYSGSRNPWPPLRTRRRTTVLAPAAVATFDVPQLSTAVRISRTPQTEPYLYQFLLQNGVAIAAGLVAAGVGEQLVRVPPDADSLTITNMGALNIAHVRALFEVYL